MPDLQLTQFSIDPEEFANEILKVRRQFNNQFRPLLHRQRRLIFTGRKKPRMERGGVLSQFGQKCSVQLEEAFALIEVMEGEAESKGEFRTILHLNRSGWRSKRTNNEQRNEQRQTIDRSLIIARSRQDVRGSVERTSLGRLGRFAAKKKSCRPGWSGSPGNYLVGCINGRPVDSPLSAQPPGTVNLRHVTTSFR